MEDPETCKEAETKKDEYSPIVTSFSLPTPSPPPGSHPQPSSFSPKDHQNPSRPLQRFRPSQYMLCVIQKAGYRMIYSPDFECFFTIPVHEKDVHRWTTVTLQQVEVEIEKRLAQLTQAGKDHPAPKEIGDVFPKGLVGGDRAHQKEPRKPTQIQMNPRQAALKLGVSTSTVRRLADRGILPCTMTHSGYRKFSPSTLDQFLAEQAAKSANRKNSL